MAPPHVGQQPAAARRSGVLELIEVAVLLLLHASYDHGSAQAQTLDLVVEFAANL